MAHKWDALSPTVPSANLRRRCSHCGKEQTFSCVSHDRMSGSVYRWTPQASRCTVNAKRGRKPRTRDAILAAMDGPTSVKEIVARAGKTRGVVQSALTRAKKAGKVQGVKGERGVWKRVDDDKG